MAIPFLLLYAAAGFMAALIVTEVAIHDQPHTWRQVHRLTIESAHYVQRQWDERALWLPAPSSMRGALPPAISTPDEACQCASTPPAVDSVQQPVARPSLPHDPFRLRSSRPYGQVLLILILTLVLLLLYIRIRGLSQADSLPSIFGGRARRREGRSDARRRPPVQRGASFADRWVPSLLFPHWLASGPSTQDPTRSPPLRYDWHADVNPSNGPVQFDGPSRGSTSGVAGTHTSPATTTSRYRQWGLFAGRADRRPHRPDTPPASGTTQSSKRKGKRVNRSERASPSELIPSEGKQPSLNDLDGAESISESAPGCEQFALWKALRLDEEGPKGGWSEFEELQRQLFQSYSDKSEALQELAAQQLAYERLIDSEGNPVPGPSGR